ncbi:hypothetical protein E2C01_001642 [Portunus trituberculatus]|uniref:Uncharacterized protein n=1 Tax=Portunus trituberculatus TaxID=210409 RepID=A0A5B7CIL0_PORTR|nr:hypothetical protein [Portunus trituberculatus]
MGARQPRADNQPWRACLHSQTTTLSSRRPCNRCLPAVPSSRTAAFYPCEVVGVLQGERRNPIVFLISVEE